MINANNQERAAGTVDYDMLYELIRGTGYVTRGQADEIAGLILAATSTTPVDEVSQALKGLLDCFHEGRLVCLNEASEGYVGSVISSAEEALATVTPPSGAAMKPVALFIDLNEGTDRKPSWHCIHEPETWDSKWTRYQLVSTPQAPTAEPRQTSSKSDGWTLADRDEATAGLDSQKGAS